MSGVPSAEAPGSLATGCPEGSKLNTSAAPSGAMPAVFVSGQPVSPQSATPTSNKRPSTSSQDNQTAPGQEPLNSLAVAGPMPVPSRFVPYYDVLRKRRESWSNFPAGLRVLVADNDPTSLQLTERMLKKCSYQVTLCSSGKNSLEILRKRREEFDIVLAEATLPDIDGFKLLNVCSNELSLPVVLMSDSPENPAIMKAIVEGARDFLIKPLRVEELRVLWQHVVRYTSEITKFDGVDPARAAGSTPSKAAPADSNHPKAEDDTQDKEGDGGASKKQRVIWSPEMHQQFVNAVNQLGIDKAVPKRILDLMNIEGLTRENVASHLQKYRLYLKRMASTQDSTAASSDNLANSSENFNSMMASGQQLPQVHGRQPGSAQQQQVHYLPQHQQPSSGPMQHISGQNPGSHGHMAMMSTNQMHMPHQQVIQMSNGSHMLVTLPQQQQQAGMTQAMVSHDVMASQHPGMLPPGVVPQHMLPPLQHQQAQAPDGMKREGMEPNMHQLQPGMSYMSAEQMGALHMGMPPQQAGMQMGAQMEYNHGGQGGSNWQMVGGSWQMGS